MRTSRLLRWPASLTNLTAGLLLFVAAFVAVVCARSSSLELPVPVRLACVGLAAVTGRVGFSLVRRARRQVTDPVDWRALDDGRPFVLYLRSFADDAEGARPGTSGGEAPAMATEEEQLLAAFAPLGRVVAVGRPTEPFPELGAARFYVGDHEWQPVVQHLIGRAELVVLRYGGTAGLHWELEQCVRLLPPERLVVLVPRGDCGPLAAVIGYLTGLPTPQLPKPPGWFSPFRGASVAGYLLFDPGWAARPVPMALGWGRGWLSSVARADFWRPQRSWFAVAFRPVFENLGRAWTPPPFRWVWNMLTLLVAVPVTVAIVFVVVEATGWRSPSDLRREEEFRRDMDRFNQMARESQLRDAEWRRQLSEWKPLPELPGPVRRPDRDDPFRWDRWPATPAVPTSRFR